MSETQQTDEKSIAWKGDSRVGCECHLESMAFAGSRVKYLYHGRTNQQADIGRSILSPEVSFYDTVISPKLDTLVIAMETGNKRPNGLVRSPSVLANFCLILLDRHDRNYLLRPGIRAFKRSEFKYYCIVNGTFI